MFSRVFIFLMLGLGGVCLSAMGVGGKTLVDLALAFGFMGASALLIARPFLRHPQNPQRLQVHRRQQVDS